MFRLLSSALARAATPGADRAAAGGSVPEPVGPEVPDASGPRAAAPGLSPNPASLDAYGLTPARWHPTVRRVYEYWLSLRSPTALPGRQHINPAAIPSALPHLFLVDVERDPLRFRYRLVGTAYSQLMGRDLTGAYYDEVHPGFNGEILRQYTAAVERGLPAYRKGRAMYVTEDRRWPIVERVIAPLATDGTTVNMIVGAIVQVDIE